MILDYPKIVDLVTGASLLTTGGGLCLGDQLASVKRHRNLSLSLIGLNDVSDDTILVTAGEVGPADAKEMEKAPLLHQMLSVWENITGMKIGGVYAPEIGQEAIIIDTAIGLGVPLVDFDVAGGRAVPFVDINSFYAAGLNFSMSPLVAATDQGDIISFSTKTSFEKVETFLRSLSSLSKTGIVYYIGGVVRAGDLRGKGVENNSLSLSLKLGNIKTLEDLKTLLSPSLTLSGKVVDKREISKSGFNCYWADFLDKSGKLYSLFILNEVLFIRDKDGKNLVTPPDKILLIDEKNLYGVSSKNLLDGHDVLLCAVKADFLWAGEQGRLLFGEDRFKSVL